jgi:hypothetical protein
VHRDSFHRWESSHKQSKIFTLLEACSRLFICYYIGILANWDSFGGLFGVLLAKDSADHITHLHGPSNLKFFLECVRPFADSDFGVNAKQPFKIQERTHKDEKSEDNTMTVHYIPVFTMNTEAKGDNHSKAYDIAYLLELKVRILLNSF